MATIEDVLKKLEKLDAIERKVDGIDVKVTNMDIKVTALDTKVGQMDTRVNKVEVQSNRQASRIEQLQLAARKSEIAQIISEENSRKYNISIGNVHMKKEYEDKETSIENVQSILNTVLKIPDAHKIIICDAHRLPTRKQRGTQASHL